MAPHAPLNWSKCTLSQPMATSSQGIRRTQQPGQPAANGNQQPGHPAAGATSSQRTQHPTQARPPRASRRGPRHSGPSARLGRRAKHLGQPAHHEPVVAEPAREEVQRRAARAQDKRGHPRHHRVAGLVLGEPLGAGTRGVDHLEVRVAAEVSHEPAARLLGVLDLEEGGLAPLVELLERAGQGDAVGGRTKACPSASLVTRAPAWPAGRASGSSLSRVTVSSLSRGRSPAPAPTPRAASPQA